MKLWLNKNWLWIIAAAVLPLGMADIVSGEDTNAEVVEPVAVSARPASLSLEEVSLDLSRLKREKVTEAKVDLFSAGATLPEALSPPPPVAPTAPPLPFTYLGKFVDGDVVTLFLSKQGQDYKARLSDVLDNDYRVEQIGDDSVEFTYLPLNTRQTLYVGQAN